jgi:hypothetical protein
MLKTWKRYKQTIKKVSDGIISILLCLLLMPFLTIAASLIELSRYQQAKQTIDELINSSSLSQLAKFDEYIDERFGLLALAQGNEIETDFISELTANSAMLGKAATLNAVSVLPSLPLSNQEVLKQQVLDFSETTVLSDILLEDLNFEDILDELSKLMGLEALKDMTGGVADTTSKISDLSDAVVGMVEIAKSFADDVNAIKTAILQADEDKKAFILSLKTLCDNFRTANFKFDLVDDLTTEENEVLKQIEDFEDSYGYSISNVITAASELRSTLATLKTIIQGLPGKFEAFEQKIDDAKNALLSAESASESAGESLDTGSTTDFYADVISQVQAAFADAYQDLGAVALDSLEAALDTFLSTLNDEFYDSFEAIYDVVESIYGGNPTGSVSETTLINMFVPDNFDFSGLTSLLDDFKAAIETALAEATATLQSEAEGGLAQILTDLINTITSIFHMEIFFDTHLISYLSPEVTSQFGSESADNPYQTFIDALETIKSAVTEFVSSGWDLIAKLKAIGKFFSALVKIVESIIQFVTNTINKIAEMFGYILSGDFTQFYKLLLMSGYMTHNLPNRTDCRGAQYTFTFDDGLSRQTVLEGTSATGFEYGSIVTTDEPISLESMLEPNDAMFRGAEAEYILAGTNSEAMNQTVAFFMLYFIRLLVNIAPVLLSPEVGTMAASATIAAWAVYLLVIILEPLVDTVLLVNGGEVPLIKQKVFITPGGLPALAAAVSDSNILGEDLQSTFSSTLDIDSVPTSVIPEMEMFEAGMFSMDYSSHLILMIMFSNTENQMLTRLSNLIYLESKAYYDANGATFEFDRTKTFTCLDTEVTATFNPFINVYSMTDGALGGMLEITRKKSRGY